MDQVVAALESIKSQGSFFSSRKTSLKAFDLTINKVGPLAFPLTKKQIKALIAIAKPAKFGWRDKTILDESVRKVWAVPPSRVKIPKKQWAAKFEPLLDKIKIDLGLPSQSKLTAQLHNMLVYEPGCFFKPHQDSEKAEGMVATLVVVLPSEHQGGELIIEHGGVKKTFKFQAIHLTKLACTAFYADCYHEVKEVTSGYRVSLTYNLVLENYQGSLTALYDPDFYHRLNQALSRYFLAERPHELEWDRMVPCKLIYLLDHQYTQKSLTWAGLKNSDRTRVDALLKIADELDLEAHLALADVQETWECEFDYQSYRERRRWGSRFDDDDETTVENATTTYIACTNTILKHWLNRQGESVDVKDFPVRDRTLCRTDGNDKFEPYESEYERWSGNAGNTVDRWYHRAAIVLWRKADHYPILFEGDKTGFVNQLFKRIKAKGSRTKLQAMLHYTANYWEAYANRHYDEKDLKKVLQLALYIQAPEISQTLLSHYSLSLFSKATLPMWLKLIKEYGGNWCLELLTTLISKQENTRRSSQVKSLFHDFPALIEKLCASAKSNKTQQSDYQLVIDGLIDSQQTSLMHNHEEKQSDLIQLQKGAENRTQELSDLMEALIIAGKKQQHLAMLDVVISHPNRYPALFMRDLFERCVPQLKKAALAAWGYPRLAQVVHRALAQDVQQGVKGQENWRIEDSLSCGCEACKQLNAFLFRADAKQTKLLINDQKRRHLSSRITKQAIFVKVEIDKTSKPYAFVVTKPEELYKEAEKRYLAVKQAKNKLEKKWRALLSKKNKVSSPV